MNSQVVLCFSNAPTLLFNTEEEAFPVVQLRKEEIQCIMLEFNTYNKHQTFRTRDHYEKILNSFKKPITRQMFYMVVGPFHRSTKKVNLMDLTDEELKTI
jgi:hypothetical protein